MGEPRAAYAYVAHESHDEGNCGHRTYLCDANGDIIKDAFEFRHPHEEPLGAWATAFCQTWWGRDVPVDLARCKVSERLTCAPIESQPMEE